MSTGARVRGACVVVGAGPGLGSAIAREFAGAGHPVGLVGRDQTPLDALRAELASGGHAVAAAVADSADPRALTGALDQLRSTLGSVEVLVYNAASYTAGPAADLPPQRLLGDYAVNVVGALRAVQHTLPDLREHGGSALLTGGGAALYPSKDNASLSLTKSGLRLLAKLLHQDLTAQGVHLTTVTIQGGIGSRPRFMPDVIARSYLDLHRQPPDQWTEELPSTD